MNIKGTIIKKTKLKTGESENGKSWRVQNVVVERQNEKYNKIICVEVFGDKIDELDNFDIGENISIETNVFSEEYNGKYYHKIRGWRFDKDTDDTPF